jgi:hypothetical protein
MEAVGYHDLYSICRNFTLDAPPIITFVLVLNLQLFTFLRGLFYLPGRQLLGYLAVAFGTLPTWPHYQTPAQ